MGGSHGETNLRHRCDIRLSVIIPSIGRDSLRPAIDSIRNQPGWCWICDRVIVGINLDRHTLTPVTVPLVHSIVIVNTPMSQPGDSGGPERESAMRYAAGTHLMFGDDDDRWLPGAVESVKLALKRNPDRPHIFKMINENGLILPMAPALVMGNIGGPQFVTPNIEAKLGKWGMRYEGDFDFIESTLALYPPGSLVWHDALIYGCRQWGGPLDKKARVAI